MQSKQYFTKIKNYPHEKSTEPLNLYFFVGDRNKKNPPKLLNFRGFQE